MTFQGPFPFNLNITQTNEASCAPTEIGHEKAQSVIDSITNSYAAEGQASSNPMLQQPGAPGAYPPPPFGFPGKFQSRFFLLSFQRASL